ncbi:MAG: PAS domain-containing sensor histidine kinase [Proteobacteria bacterium]|nr:MAG: PAS domain-containing sensor histidine kinase [Pseudomonadota bacterium]
MTGGALDLWAVLPVPVLETGADDAICAANPAAEGFLNLSERSLTGRPLWEVLRAASDLSAAFARARHDGSPLTAAQIEIAPPGRGPLRATLHCVPAGEGMLVAIALSDPGPGLSGAQTHKAARAAIGMAEMLAHEIKNPLAGITGAAQLLSMSLSPEDQELTDLIVGECRRITALLAQVEHFGNLQPSARAAVNLHDVLDRARQSAALGFAAHMALVEDYDPSLPEAFVDRDQILQVVLNLLKNAAEANPRGGTIRLRSFYDPTLRARDGEKLPLQIEISDDGPGLPPEIADQVFDPFVSGRENGTGLGLALVSKLMRDNGGLVSVESAPGRTIFRLSLPRRPKE